MRPRYLICGTTGKFADDVDARCAQCGAPIQHRPHVPPDFVKICLSCAADVLKLLYDAKTDRG